MMSAKSLLPLSRGEFDGMDGKPVQEFGGFGVDEPRSEIFGDAAAKGRTDLMENRFIDFGGRGEGPMLGIFPPQYGLDVGGDLPANAAPRLDVVMTVGSRVLMTHAISARSRRRGSGGETSREIGIDVADFAMRLDERERFDELQPGRPVIHGLLNPESFEISAIGNDEK